MESLLHFFQTYFPFIFEHKHLFLFLGAAIEGLNTFVLGGFLVSTGVLSFPSLFLVFLSGYMINGYLWYAVGYLAGAKPLDWFVRRDERGRKILERVELYFKRYSGWAIVLTKFTFSLTIACLIMAGSLRYSIKRFSLYNAIGSVGWVAMTMGIGYFFGQSYKLIFTEALKSVTYAVVFFAGAVVLIYFLKRKARSVFVHSLILRERLRIMRDKLKEHLNNLSSGQ